MASKIPIKYNQLFINNEFVNSISGKAIAVINPSTAETLCNVQEADKADVDRAVHAARSAFKLGSPWRTMDASNRGRLMYKLAELIERDGDYLAKLESLNCGKPLNFTQMDVDFGCRVLRYYAGYADKIHGKTIPADGDIVVMTRLEPVGVCGMILPWNAPILMVVNKMSPALATGNCVVVKPSELTPLTALYICALAKEAGFPAGVINIVNGYGPSCGAAISEHMDIDAVSFTGSTFGGKLIQAAAGKSNAKRVTLEMGGKSPLVIFDDANVEEAATWAHEGLFYNQGQLCCAASRVYVQEGIYDAFVKCSRELALKRIVGDPLQMATKQGPQVNKIQFNKILEMIESGKKEGAKVECGGAKVPGTNGFFIQPTVFSNVTDQMIIGKDEIFGPVQPILKFKTLEEVIERANNSVYGLAAGVFTKDINQALTYANSVSAGTVWVNCYLSSGPQCPFGGYKMSGHGRELGEDGLSEFLEVKTITVKIPQKNS